MTKPYKPIIAVDFDGVIHLYRKGWVDDVTINDEVHPGFFPWVQSVAPYYRVVIFSSRCREAPGILAIRDWLLNRYADWAAAANLENPELVWDAIEFSSCKPPATLSIDDRAVTFQGSFEPLTPEFIKAFKPWNKSEDSPTLQARLAMGLLTGPQRLEVMAGYCPGCGSTDGITVCNCFKDL